MQCLRIDSKVKEKQINDNNQQQPSMQQNMSWQPQQWNQMTPQQQQL